MIPTGFDWYLLLGDETALPAIARCLEQLPAGKQAIVLIEVADASAELDLSSAATLNLQWLHRQHGDETGLSRLADAVAQLSLPTGEGYAWAAGESAAIQAVRKQLVGTHGMDKSRIRAASYWKQGATAVHETLDD
ncbi:siderophore-interacting protein [Chitinimonas arctica]|uniref:siderophore-interacting protein n=1 Tax=Chitinimonas arctica TaxID=2594795 RepID=UPI0027E5A75D|nr:siderophore-interacting protein [Chitinimonas arctica]